ncbi:MAG: YigZ family protein [Lachnospiraceae bacterium]|nr:YigZ family protein [Lachnospiraceae bacterium]
MEEYLALIEGGQDEIVEKKSRFIGYTAPVSTEEEAVAFVERIKKKHYDARHNCYAYSIGTDNQPLLRFSDDGEPQGTAGKPILEVIQGSDIRNICIVVTRYFGGTLLGTGGLVRAYTDAAKAGIEASVVRLKRQLILCELPMEYTDLGKMQYLIANTDAEITDTVYTDKVVLKVRVYAPVYERFVKEVTEATGAKVVVEKTGEVFD